MAWGERGWHSRKVLLSSTPNCTISLNRFSTAQKNVKKKLKTSWEKTCERCSNTLRRFFTFCIKASALPQWVTVLHILSPAPPERKLTNWSKLISSFYHPDTDYRSAKITDWLKASLTSWWTGWRQSSSRHPRHSRGLGPGSSRSRLCRTRRSDAATPGSGQHLMTRTAVAITTHEKIKYFHCCVLRPAAKCVIESGRGFILLFLRRSSWFWQELCSVFVRYKKITQ